AMPLQYEAGIMAEHLHCRAEAALFDVSHMGQASLEGEAAAAALERLVPGDILGLKPWRQRYTLLTDDAGGILDDLMIANLGARFLLIVNASRKAFDFAHIAAALPATVRLVPHPDHALLALQGPAAARVLARLDPGLAALPFLGVAEARLLGTRAIIARSGYTGEDGFEISVPAEAAERLASALLAEPEVRPAGLGARDSLRLEAGLCLYGADIDTTTTPIEAGLGWTIGKRRRLAWDFPGGAAIRAQHDHGPARLRVGIRPEGRAPARAGAQLLDASGAEIGGITSGCFSPSLNAPIAMGYVASAFAPEGTKLAALVRGKPLPCAVAPMPFVPHRYLR
ncbi:MAG TPA: glycine cleavage system aminomethyltransferase GcvT, partial [Acetobacteraceae bacterium]|nr:glycine cleavage system aminomethyltransferase GcvT [Acetobacteraceae bacterium]